jgi:hypothetical protein
MVLQQETVLTGQPIGYSIEWSPTDRRFFNESLCVASLFFQDNNQADLRPKTILFAQQLWLPAGEAHLFISNYPIAERFLDEL